MSDIPTHIIDIGDLVEDVISGKTGVVIEIKRWAYNNTSRDMYIRWTDGETFWVDSKELTVISKTHGVYNEALHSKYGLVISIVPKSSSYTVGVGEKASET